MQSHESSKTPFTPLIELNRIIRENRVEEYRAPAMTLGMRPEEFGHGTSRWRWDIQPLLAVNPFGMIHGGFLAVFVDELLATAIGSILDEGEWAMTGETKISHLRMVQLGSLVGEARVLRRGQAMAFLEADIKDADGKLAVRASSTWSISR